MRIEPKNVVLKDGTKAVIRNYLPSDAKQSIELNLNMSNTTEYMMKYPEEVSTDVDREVEAINNALESNGMSHLGLFIDNQLIGFGGLFPVGNRIRTSHRGGVGIGVHSNHRGLGIGKLLINVLIEAAKNYGYKQLELDVVSENKEGIGLYKSVGFKKTGMIPNAFIMKNGKVYDFDIMILDLGDVNEVKAS